MRRPGILICLLIFIASFGSLSAELRPSHVLVLANANSARSMEVAHYYMQKRNIPTRNLIALPLSGSEVISWQEYIDTLHNPLAEALVSGGWMQADKSDTTDRIGRRHYAIFGHDVDFLVFSMDVPLKINDDPKRMPPQRPDSIQPEFWTNRAAVDSELSLLPFPESAVVAYMPNPLFNVTNPGKFTRQQVLRIARLDGPDVASVKALVDHAMQAEKDGLRGRAYIDLSQKYPQGDDWLKLTGKLIEDTGYDITYDTKPELIQWNERFDAPALYFGWWAWQLEGVMSDPNFRFPPGAVVLHIHSFSANTVRSATKNWVGPLVARGVSATVGNVYEPYLHLTHWPHFFFDALKRGKATGEAAYTAAPVLSWHTLFIGDPLYRPFAKSLDDQLESIRPQTADALDQYVVIRKMNQLVQDGRSAEASILGRRYMHLAPGLAVAFHIAQQKIASGDVDEAFRALRTIESMQGFALWDQALAHEVAMFMTQHGARQHALHLFYKLLEQSRLAPQIEAAVLLDAVPTASQQGEYQYVERWRARQMRSR